MPRFRSLWSLVLFLTVLGSVLMPSSSMAQGGGYLGCQWIEQIPRDECEALEALYDNTFGEHWVEFRGWKRSNQPCEWHGVFCNSKEWPRNVTVIRLVNNNIGGTFPGEIANLPELRELVIENRDTPFQAVKMGGVLIADLSKLEHLEILSLTGNTFTGSIPTDWGNFKSLRILYLNDNELTGQLPHELSKLAALEELDLRDNNFSGPLPSEWGQLHNLVDLQLAGNNLGGALPQELGDMKSLVRLDLSNNRFRGALPSSLSRLENTIWFSAEQNQLDAPMLSGVAEWAGNLSFCSLADNTPTMCVPNSALYTQAFPDGDACGLAPSSSCEVCSLNRGIDSGDCQGLETLFNETGGANWLNRDGWLAQEDPCMWNGVGCTDGRVHELILPANNLSGAVPTSLGDLSALEVLDLSANALVGRLPLPVVQVAANTSTCDLTGNSASLCIPDQAEYQEFGLNPICGLSLMPICEATTSNVIAQFDSRLMEGNVVLEWSLNPGSAGPFRYVIEERIGSRYISVPGIDPEGVIASGSFSITVNDVSEGIHLYRLQLFDLEGKLIESQQTSVARLNNASILIEPVFPNPAGSEITVRLVAKNAGPVNVVLYDALGRRVLSVYQGNATAGQVMAINTSVASLAPGTYFLHFESDNALNTQRLIVLR